MLKLSFVPIVMLISMVFANPSQAIELEIDQSNLRNLVVDGDGFIKNTTGDGYLSFRDLTLSRAQACAIRLDLEFKSPMIRPAIFEVFWHAPDQGSSEKKKSFVIIHQDDTTERREYVIPLCKLYHFSGNLNQGQRQGAIAGLRFDYPTKRTTEIKFHSISTLNGDELLSLIEQSDSNISMLEPYERIDARSFTSLDVILPKLFFAFEQGLKRLSYDKVFTFSWLLMMLSILVLIVRSYLRQYRQ